jgi:hypothetical protein
MTEHLCSRCLARADVSVRNTKKTLHFCHKHWSMSRKSLERGHGYVIVTAEPARLARDVT